MKHLIGKKVLVTTSAWFVAPDGKEYKSIWGTLKCIHTSEETLGFTPSRQHTNWFIEVGDMIVAGCQVLYVNTCNEPPYFDDVYAWSVGDSKGYSAYHRPSIIYNATLE